MTAARPLVDACFIRGPAGPLAVVVWQPPSGHAVTFGVLHVPAAGDEMNKSRRMVALQARALAARGAVVAVVDLRGTGDSGGEHGDATWSGWGDDVRCAWEWLGAQLAGVPRVLWGLRLGGLLATALASSGGVEPDVLLLWQPVTSGRTFFNQWLRVANTRQLAGRADSTGDARSLRATLAAGASIEIAGYALGPELVQPAEAIDMAALSPPSCPVVWRETTGAQPPTISPAGEKVRTGWQAGAALDFAAVPGPSFWASQEIAEAPRLVEATTAAICDCFATTGATD